MFLIDAKCLAGTDWIAAAPTLRSYATDWNLDLLHAQHVSMAELRPFLFGMLDMNYD